MGQCRGTTKKGERCKIQVETKPYCHYHISQGQGQQKTAPSKKFLSIVPRPLSNQATFETGRPTHTARKSPAVISQASPNGKTRTKNGYIYLYTLQHLISSKPEKQSWLRIHKGKTESKVFDPKNQILIKVGCTTTSVPLRLKQWESQCHHKLSLIDPYNTLAVLDPISLLVNRFAKFNLAQQRNYTTYKFQELGFKSENQDILVVEWKIHQLLREMYGYGTVYCSGCSDLGKGETYKIHVEWFLIPRKDINRVFKLIDRAVAGR